MNTYDNTLVYVDYIVDKAINLLKEHQDKFTSSLVYLSDHGESLGEKWHLSARSALCHRPG